MLLNTDVKVWYKCVEHINCDQISTLLLSLMRKRTETKLNKFIFLRRKVTSENLHFLFFNFNYFLPFFSPLPQKCFSHWNVSLCNLRTYSVWRILGGNCWNEMEKKKIILPLYFWWGSRGESSYSPVFWAVSTKDWCLVSPLGSANCSASLQSMSSSSCSAGYHILWQAIFRWEAL